MLKVGSARALVAEQPEMADRLLADMETDIEGTLAEVRRIVYELRPPALDQLGLAGAVKAFAAACESGELGETQTSLTMQAEIQDDLPPLPAAVEVAAYHIAREALTNVVRYAQAEQCRVRLEVQEGEKAKLHLTIEDNGQGFPHGTRTGVGLAAMRERAAELGGTCSIESQLGEGTRVAAVLPLDS
jgi:signal transduction histidine kinase